MSESKTKEGRKGIEFSVTVDQVSLAYAILGQWLQGLVNDAPEENRPAAFTATVAAVKILAERGLEKYAKNGGNVETFKVWIEGAGKKIREAEEVAEELSKALDAIRKRKEQEEEEAKGEVVKDDSDLAPTQAKAAA